MQKRRSFVVVLGLWPLLAAGATPTAKPTNATSLKTDPERAKVVLRSRLGQAPAQASQDQSWIVRWSALQRSAPDAQGLKTAVKLLGDPALVVRMQAVHWISAYGQALLKQKSSLPDEAKTALWEQLSLRDNFQNSGTPLAVAVHALSVLRKQMTGTVLGGENGEQKKTKDRVLQLRSLAGKTRSQKWRAELLSFAQELDPTSSKPRQ